MNGLSVQEFVMIGVKKLGSDGQIVAFVPWSCWFRLHLELGTPASDIRFGVTSSRDGVVYIAHEGREISVVDRVGRHRALGEYIE